MGFDFVKILNSNESKIKFDFPISDCDEKIPMSIIKGKEKGENLLISAGVHGAEYVGIRTLSLLFNEIDINLIKGNLILIHCINVDAFYNHRPFTMKDGKNFNRIFPVKEFFSFSNKVGKDLTENILPFVNYHIDLHSGDCCERLIPHVYFKQSEDEKLSEITKKMAMSTNSKYAVVSYDNSGFYNNSFNNNIPSILIEQGQLGICTNEDVKLMYESILGVMYALKMYKNNPIKKPLDKILKNVTYPRAENDGLFYSYVTVGQKVYKGDLLAKIKDFYGVPLEKVIADHDGEVLYMTSSLSIKKGYVTVVYGE